MLKLQSLKLDGFLSYDKAEIALDDEGITFIQGETGAGKSSIFEAVLYLLYGKTLRKRSSLNDLENKVLNRGFDISLSFQIDNVNYVVRERRNTSGNNGLYFFENGVDARAKTDTLTRTKIKQLLGLSDEEFKNLVFLGQRQSQKFIEGTNGERGQLLTELFNLEKYDLLADKAEKVLKANFLEKDRAIASSEDLKRSIQEIKDTLKTQKKATKIDPELLDKTENQINELVEELRKVRYEERKVRDSISKAELSQKNVEKLAELTKQLKTLNEALVNIPTTKYAHDELISLNEKGKARRDLLFQKMSKREKELEKLAVIEDICPISKKECSLKVPTRFKRETEKELKDELSRIETEFDEIDRKLTKISRFLRHSKDADDLRREIESKEAILASMKASIVEISEEETARLIKNLSYFTQKIDNLELKISEKNNLFNNLKTKKCLYEQQEAYLASMNSMLDERAKLLVEKQQKIVELSNKDQYLSVAARLFKQLKLYKIDAILERINVNIQGQLNKISDSLKINFSSMKTGSKGKTLDCLNISITNRSVELPIEMLSGGQTTQVGLAILLGMYKTVYELSDKSVNLLFLDEAFGTLSDDIIDETFESIVSLTKELGFNNVKIISHRQLDSRKFDHLWQINRVNGLSSISILS